MISIELVNLIYSSKKVYELKVSLIHDFKKPNWHNLVRSTPAPFNNKL